jgi:hypothetical protein
VHAGGRFRAIVANAVSSSTSQLNRRRGPRLAPLRIIVNIPVAQRPPVTGVSAAKPRSGSL